MKNKTNNLSRSEKILLFLSEYGDKGKEKIRYEDIVVGVFKKYPQDFHLKGYKEYPDSGDLHKSLYSFKKKGYVNAENKIFSLTERGLELAQQLLKTNKSNINSENRLSRSSSIETSRIVKLEGLAIFLKGKRESISDNDFYNYLGVTVRTQKNAFIGRLKTVSAMIEEIKKYTNNEIFVDIIKYHDFLMSRYSNIIEYFNK